MKKNTSCNLGSLNLSAFVINPYTSSAEFNFKEFKKAISIAIKALDDIIDENLDNHPLKEQRKNAKNFRNVGLGVFGYANMLFELGLTYGSEKAKEFTEKLFETMFLYALESDTQLAKERGAFPKCKPDLINKADIMKNVPSYIKEDINKYGLRNCSLLSIAPNGSIATLLNCSGGSEPEFALKYIRKTDNLDSQYDMYCKSVNDYWEVIGTKTENLPDYFVTSSDINWEDRISVQAIIQKYIDTAISSTVNLPKETKVADIEQLYLNAWEKGLKGVTIYRSGCKREGILVTEDGSTTKEPQEELTLNDIPRGYIVDVTDDVIGKKRKLNIGCGSLHVTAFFNPENGNLVETYLSKGSTGGCQNYMIGLSRMISLAARAGSPIEAIVDQLNSCGACPSYAVRSATKHDTSKGSSCPVAIGNALLDMYNEMQNELGLNDNFDDEDISSVRINKEIETTTNIVKNITTGGEACPECGAKLEHINGCVQCSACGYSKCS